MALTLQYLLRDAIEQSRVLVPRLPRAIKINTVPSILFSTSEQGNPLDVDESQVEGSISLPLGFRMSGLKASVRGCLGEGVVATYCYSNATTVFLLSRDSILSYMNRGGFILTR